MTFLYWVYRSFYSEATRAASSTATIDTTLPNFAGEFSYYNVQRAQYLAETARPTTMRQYE